MSEETLSPMSALMFHFVRLHRAVEFLPDLAREVAPFVQARVGIW
jgi:hypothetical protein